MNALHRDLERLVDRVEREDASHVQADPYRQHFHLMPPVGWMNDPNGLCRCGEWYHVFYQYGPFDATGGVKLWGHYRSRDLLRWEKAPAMLYPDQTWNLHGVYSGSALIEDGVMYLYYTGNVKHPGAHDYIKTGRGHNTALAVSRDGVTAESNELLMTNQDYPEGLSCHVRDPKVWRENGRYYMVQGARTMEDRGEILLFASDDKRRWSHINTLTTPGVFGYMWECPDLFEIAGQRVLACSPQGVSQQGMRFQNVYTCGYFPLYGDFCGAYSLGAFAELDCGFDFYAPQTFLDGDRRLMLGWMGMPDAEYENPTVSNGWQHCATVMCEVVWRDGRLLRRPVAELEQLRGERCVPEDAEIFDLEYVPQGDGAMTIRGSAVIEWRQGELILRYETGGAGRTMRRTKVDTVRNLRVLADASSLEIFVNEGETVLSSRYYPPVAARGVCFHGEGKAKLWKMHALSMTEMS